MKSNISNSFNLGNLDHGVINISLSKRGDINKQLDQYKAEQNKAEKECREAKKEDFKALQIKAKAMFAELTKDHFFFYAKQLVITQRQAKAELKSDTHWRPKQAILVMNAIIMEVDES